MKLKKLLAKSFVICSAASALLATGLSANAAIISDTLSVSGFYTYTNDWDGEHSAMYAYPDMTGITTAEPDYYSSYKWVRYAVYGESNDSYYSIYSIEDSGTARTLFSDPRTITSDVVRRIHKAQLHYSSLSSSSVVDDYYLKIDKK